MFPLPLAMPRPARALPSDPTCYLQQLHMWIIPHSPPLRKRDRMLTDVEAVLLLMIQSTTQAIETKGDDLVRITYTFPSRCLKAYSWDLC